MNSFILILLHKELHEKMILCEVHKLCEKFILRYGIFNEKQIIPNIDGVNTKKSIRKRKKNIILYW